MKTTLADRLIQICVDQGLPVGRGRNAALSKLLNLSSGRLTQIFSPDGTPDPTIRLGEKGLRNLVKRGYHPDWIQEGIGEKWSSHDTDERAASGGSLQNLPYNPTVIMAKAPRQVPVIEVSTTDGGKMRNTDQYADVATSDDQAFVIAVPDNTMYPRYFAGEYALVEPSVQPDIEDDVLLLLKSGALLLRRLASRKGGIRLSAFNEEGSITIQPDEVEWMYYVAHAIPAKQIHREDK